MTVLVGTPPDQQKVTVHESLIIQRSRFFRNALIGPYKEAETRTVDLSDEDPDIFSLYLQALYSNHVSLEDDGEELDDIYITWGELLFLQTGCVT